MSQEKQEKGPTQKSAQEQLNQPNDLFSLELVEAIRQTTFATLAVASVRGFTDLKITAIRKIVEDMYAVRFTYFTLNRVEKETGWITEPTFTEGQGLYIHQFAPTLYLDASAISNLTNDLIHPPLHD